MLNNKTLERLSEFIRRLQEVTELKQFQAVMMRMIEEVFSASDSLIVDWLPSRYGERLPDKGDLFFHKYEKYEDWDYTKVRHEDPIYHWIDTGQLVRDQYVARITDLIDFRHLKRTNFYNKMMLPMNVRYVLTMVLTDGNSVLASVSVVRTPDLQNFSQSDIRLARLLVPILSSTYSQLVTSRELGVRDDLFDILSDEIKDQALVIFSHSLQSIYRSEKMITLGKQLRKHHESIMEIFSQSPALAKYVDNFSSPHQSVYRRLPEKISDSVTIKRGQVLNIALTSTISDTGRRYLTATLSPASKDSNANLQAEYGLTLRECQIAQLAAKGCTSREIGEKLALSPWSVKTHLKNIYKKTGVNNRASLAQIT